MRSRLRAATVATLLVVTGLVAWGVRLGVAQRVPSSDPGTATAIAERAATTADAVVARYVALQRDDGAFPDPVVETSGDYGTAMLGIAMLRRGHERRDGALLAAGAAALRQPAELPTFGVFELLVLAQAYAWGEQTLLADPFAAGTWSQTRGILATAVSNRGALTANPAVISCLARTSCYGNQKLVAGLAAEALLQANLGAAREQALLADRAALERRVEEVAARAAREVGDGVVASIGPSRGPAGVLSDPPRNPLAYHALSVMLLGDLLDALGTRAPAALPDAFDRAGRGLLRLASPDGDLAYYGRGQGQVWVPAVTVAAAAMVATRTQDHATRGAALALAAAALDRLERRHGLGRYGLALVPGAGTADALATRAVDSYASTRSYNGLAVAALDAAEPLLRSLGSARATAVPAAAGGVVVGGVQAHMLSVGTDRVWAAVSTDPRNRIDARYGSGLLSLRRRDGAGRWVDAVPAPPVGIEPTPTLAIDTAGRRFVPRAVPKRLEARRTAVAIGRWLDPASGIELPGDAVWRWRARGDGTVVGRFRSPCSCSVAVGVRSRGGASVRRSMGAVVVTDGSGTVTWKLGVPGRGVRLGPARPLGPSAYESELEVRELSVAVDAGEAVSLELRATG